MHGFCREQLNRGLSAALLVLAFAAGYGRPALAAPGDILFTDNFERSVVAGGSNTAGAVGTAPGYGAWTVGPLAGACAGVTGNRGCAGIDSDIPPYNVPSNARANTTRALYTRWSLATVDSPVINLAGKPGVSVSFWLRRGSDCFSEWPSNNLTGCNGTIPPFTPSTGEEFQVQYKNSASTWVTIAQYAMDDPPGEIMNPTIELPADALWSGFQLRFRQPGGSGSNATTGGAPGVRGYDYWHVDDVVIRETAAVFYTGPFCDTFETDLSRWNVTGTGNARIGSTYFQNGAHDMDLRWRNITASSLPTDLSGGTGTNTITYWARRGSGSVTTVPNTTGSDLPDAGENLTVDYLNNGGTWTNLATYAGGGTGGQVFNGSFTIPANANLSAFSLRFSLATGSGLDQDYWHIDNVCVGAALPTSNFGVTQTRSGALVPGQNASYDIAVTNAGPDTTTGTITVTDTLPAGLSYVSAAGSGWSCSVSGQTVTCTHATGASVPVLTLTVAVSPTAAGNITNTVTVANSATIDPDQANNTSTDTYNIVPAPYAYYAMDEISWTGVAGEVKDSSGNSHDATALNAVSTITTGAAGSKGNTCRGANIPVDTSAGTIKGVNTGIDLNNVGNAGSISFWYKSNRDWDAGNNSDGRVLLDASGSSTTEFWLMLRKDGDLRFSLDDSTAQRQRTTSNKYTTNAGTWVHIAVTWDFNSGIMTIFRNGVSVAQRTGMTDNNGDPSSTNPGWGTLHIGDTIAGVPASNGANGVIDEVRVYSVAMTAAQVTADMNASHSCSSFDHLQIEHDGEASNCGTESITVKACANISCSALTTTGGITASLQPFNTAINIGVTGTQTLLVTPSATGTNTLNATSIAPVPTNVTQVTCVNTVASAPSCSLLVSACPGSFDCLESAITPYSSGSARLYTKLAGSPFAFDVVALNASNAVETDYVVPGATAKNVTVELFDDSGSPQPACSAYSSPVASQTLSIGSASAGRKTTANFSVANAYPKLRCRVRDANATPTVYGCSSDDFSVRPSAATLVTSATAAAPSAASTPVIKTGASFTLGATTSASGSYSGALALDTGKLTAQITTQDATQVSGGVVGALTPASLTANAAAVNATYGEVGYLYLAPGAYRDDAFTAVDSAAGDCITSTAGDANLADTLSGGKYGCSIGNKTAVSLGRFIPDHFDVSVNTHGAMAGGCAGFTYTGQAMGYNGTSLPALTVKPMNAASAGNVAQNYQGVFQKLTAAGVTITSPTADAVQLGLDGLTKTALTAAMSAGALTNIGGTMTYTLNAGDQFTYTRDANALVGRYTTGIPLAVTAVAEGEVSAAGGLPTLNPAGVSMRFGRLRLSNAFGTGALQMPMLMQYWSGSTWVLNSDDSCSVVPLSAASASSVAVTPSCVAAPTNYCSATDLQFLGGKSYIKLTSSAASGTADICLDLGADPSPGVACAATSSGQSYLQGRWPPGTAYNNDPKARATFGVYSPESKKSIHTREQY